jgi:hypothetical protein
MFGDWNRGFSGCKFFDFDCQKTGLDPDLDPDLSKCVDPGYHNTVEGDRHRCWYLEVKLPAY